MRAQQRGGRREAGRGNAGCWTARMLPAARACRLEELFAGSTRKMKINRLVTSSSGQQHREEEVGHGRAGQARAGRRPLRCHGPSDRPRTRTLGGAAGSRGSRHLPAHPGRLLMLVPTLLLADPPPG